MRLELADESLTEGMLERLRSVGCRPLAVSSHAIEFALPYDPADEPWHPQHQQEVELRFLLRAWFPGASFRLDSQEADTGE
jgi:hypothetical protein